MDKETGEGYRDHETGELPAIPQLNSETGESEINHKRPETTPKKPFKIPNAYIKANNLDNEKPGMTKKVILTNCGPPSPVLLFLLPTIILFYPIVSIPLGIIEVILHVWAHKKNKSLRLENKDVYVESPMHVFVSEFCATCRDERAKDTIGQLQDKKNKRFVKYGIEYVRRIV